MKVLNNSWVSFDPNLSDRFKKIAEKFTENFTTEPSHCIIAPGRAEILGNHTDYNAGRTLSVNIRNNLLLVGSKRVDSSVHLLSLNQDQEPVQFDIKDFEKSEEGSWINYVKGVIVEFIKLRGPLEYGFNIVIESTVPMGGGVSSSAAIELAMVHLLETLYGFQLDPVKRVQMAKSAENNYVGSPCGFLDQGTIELSDAKWLMMDYRSDSITGAPFTYSTIENKLQNIILVIGYDPKTKRQLTEGKYAIRRQCCELVAQTWKKMTGQHIDGVCTIKQEDFETKRELLKTALTQQFSDPQFSAFFKKANWPETLDRAVQMLEWVSHPIADNERIDEAIAAISAGDAQKLGELFSASGKTGIYSYQLGEGVQELEWVYKTVTENAAAWGVYGIRNMGGGFNATTLALVKSDMLETYKKELNARYKTQFNTDYIFIDFTPSPAVSVSEV